MVKIFRTATATCVLLCAPMLVEAASLYSFAFDNTAFKGLPQTYSGDNPDQTWSVEGVIEIESPNAAVTQADVVGLTYTVTDGVTRRTVTTTGADFSGTQVAGGLEIETLRTSIVSGKFPDVEVVWGQRLDSSAIPKGPRRVFAKAIEFDNKGIAASSFEGDVIFDATPFPQATYVAPDRSDRVYEIDLSGAAGDWSVTGEVVLKTPGTDVTESDVESYTLTLRQGKEQFTYTNLAFGDRTVTPSGLTGLKASVSGGVLEIEDLSFRGDVPGRKGLRGEPLSWVLDLSTTTTDKTGKPIPPATKVEFIERDLLDKPVNRKSLANETITPPAQATRAPLKTYDFAYDLIGKSVASFQSFTDGATQRDWKLTGSLTTRSLDGWLGASEVEAFRISVTDDVDIFDLELGGQGIDNGSFAFLAYPDGDSLRLFNFALQGLFLGEEVSIEATDDNRLSFSGLTRDLKGIPNSGFESTAILDGPCGLLILDKEGKPTGCNRGITATRVAAPVPLPASAWLLVAACGGLAVAGRRRALRRG